MTLPTRRGSILIGLLWCLALLAVLVIGVLHSARLELRVSKNHADSMQAYYLALAGIEKAKAVIYLDAKTRRESAKNHTGTTADDPRQFKDIKLGRGQFRVFRQASRFESEKVVYGVTDEEGRLNVNTADAEALRRLDQMPPEVIAAIMDFRDTDQSVGPGGAEAEYYAALRPPYMPKNAPFESIRELLLVKGISREQLFGEDSNQNGLLDGPENDGALNPPVDNRDGFLDAGWSAHLTAYSSVKNVNASGRERVNVQEADEATLLGVSGMTTDMAKAIIARRGQNKFESLIDLLNVVASSPNPGQQPEGQTPGAPQGAPPTTRPGQNQPPQGPRAPEQGSGQPLITEDQLLTMADDLTTSEDDAQPGLINVNTASIEVLICLPGITRELAQAIINHRQSSGFFQNTMGLLKVPGLNRDLIKPILERVCVRSETFQILAEGKVDGTGARRRIMEVIRLESSGIRTLYHREEL